MEPKSLFLLLAQQTKARPVQVPGIWRRRQVAEKKKKKEGAQPWYRGIKRLADPAFL
jgi:hypothetical protein